MRRNSPDDEVPRGVGQAWVELRDRAVKERNRLLQAMRDDVA
jgi:hypothetical protein